ncbi:MAG: alpha-galactosidase [Terriglobia bacterium]
MIRPWTVCLFTLALIAPAFCLFCWAGVPLKADFTAAHAWRTVHFPGSKPSPEDLPISFSYHGRTSSELLKEWKFNSQVRPGPEGTAGWIYEYVSSDSVLRLRCELTWYSDFPALEWVLSFENVGEHPSGILEDILPLDTQFKVQTKDIRLRYAKGASNQPSDFSPQETAIDPENEYRFGPNGGLSSSGAALPFFNLMTRTQPGLRANLDEEMTGGTVENRNVIVGIGWSGQWKMNVARRRSDLAVQAGMERTRIQLFPGERIRTPRILLLFWSGNEWVRSQNLLRSFLLAHHTPRPAGQLPLLPVASIPWFQYEYGNKANAKNQMEVAQFFHKNAIPIDTFWLDAGWFEGGWPDGVGNWFPKKDFFPGGLRPLSDTIHRLGYRFLVWFEPERAAPGTWLERSHPEWLLDSRDADPKRKLLNLGNQLARHWLIERVSGLIEQEGIDIYRQDFSLEPLENWRQHDNLDRQGMTEILYVQGLYEVWDALLQHHPSLLIDNAASGGRRLDLETLSRSIPLWRFDYFGGEVTAFQAHSVGLGLFIPLSATGMPPTKNNPMAEIPDPYTTRSLMSAGMALTWDIRKSDFNVPLARKLVREQNDIRKYFYGDLYPLTEITSSEQKWFAYQYHRPDLREGMIMIFRRASASDKSIVLQLHGLEEGKTYAISDRERGTTLKISGRKLTMGLWHTLPRPRSSSLLIYKEISKSE